MKGDADDASKLPRLVEIGGSPRPNTHGRGSSRDGEWRDVEAAVQNAVANGVTEIVLFGWSLGGAIALRLTDLSAHSERIVGLILDAPVMDWQTTLAANAGASGLPCSIATLGLRLLQSPTMLWVPGFRIPSTSPAWIG